MTFEPGDKLCSCTLLVKCGEGSYGEVWLAENAIGGKVALKILKKKFSEREIRGLQNYKDCDHPNLLKIRHIEISDDFVCYTMDAADDLNNGKGDYLPDTLANRLNKNGRLDGKEITAMLDGVLDGLEELHKHGLVHRDIKPDNILYINGRATLSDAGLIAPVGQNTLVGSPGFISPRLMESGGVAETSDDFYALSKVVFCALTGLAPAEYPTIPQEMTISVDPKINRAVLAGCSQEIKSSAEFRKAVAGKVIPQPQKKPETKIVTIERVKTPLTLKIILTVLTLILAAVVFWMVRSEYLKSAATKQQQELLAKSIASAPELPDWKQEFLRDRKERLNPWFHRFGLLKGSYFQELLNHKVFTKESIEPQVDKLMNLRFGTPAYQHLFDFKGIFFSPAWQNPDAAKVRERQKFWKKQEGNPSDVAYRMLTEDPVMQMVAVNWMLERFCRLVLEKEDFGGQLKENVKKLIDLQEDFTNPDFGVVKYIGRKEEKKQKL